MNSTALMRAQALRPTAEELRRAKERRRRGGRPRRKDFWRIAQILRYAKKTTPKEAADYFDVDESQISRWKKLPVTHQCLMVVFHGNDRQRIWPPPALPHFPSPCEKWWWDFAIAKTSALIPPVLSRLLSHSTGGSRDN